MTGSGARRAQWNLLLLQHVVAPAYAAALKAAAAALGPGAAYDRLWPAADVAAPWRTLLVALWVGEPQRDREAGGWGEPGLGSLRPLRKTVL